MINNFSSLLSVLLAGLTDVLETDAAVFCICFALIGYTFRLFVGLLNIFDFNQKNINK